MKPGSPLLVSLTKPAATYCAGCGSTVIPGGAGTHYHHDGQIVRVANCDTCGAVCSDSSRFGRGYELRTVAAGKPWESVIAVCECCAFREQAAARRAASA